MRFDKYNIAILLLTLLLVIMLPLEFTWSDSVLEMAEDSNYEFSIVLFWIFYISAAATCAAAVFNRYDLAKITSIISLVVILILIPQTINIVEYEGSFFEYLFLVTDFAWAYVAATVCIFGIVLRRNRINADGTEEG